jgi:lipopolysaccharide assembly protein A
MPRQGRGTAKRHPLAGVGGANGARSRVTLTTRCIRARLARPTADAPPAAASVQRRHDMRWINMAVTAILVGALLIFALQNLQSITVDFLSFSLRAPLSVLAIVIYLLGMWTGGSVWALIRWAVEGSKPSAA